MKKNMNENMNPNDAVKRVLLMMKYDLSQTLTENKEIIFEQAGCANSISKEEFLELVKETVDEIKSMDDTFVRMFNQTKSAQLVYDNISRISKHNVYDNLDNSCKNGIDELKRNFKYYFTSFIGGDYRGVFANSTLIGVLKDFREGYYSDVPEVTRYLDATIRILQNPPKVEGETTTKLTDEEKLRKAKACGHNSWEEYKKSNWSCTKNKKTEKEITPTPTPVKKSQFKVCTGTYSVGCKSQVIRKAQGCLGITADGLFGPETKGAIVAKLGKSAFTDADVNTICGTTTQTTQKVSPTPIPEPEELGSDTTNINDFMKGM
jgi:hypothetical protein